MFVATVCGGRPQKGMPAWCTIGLTPAQIDTIYSYVKGRSDAKLHPGRPARRGE
jgi:mono/diheme cytochrome c family protein